LDAGRDQHEKLEKAVSRLSERVKELESKAAVKENEGRDKEKIDAGLLALQKEYQTKQKERAGLRDEEFAVERQIELSKIKAETSWTPLPLHKIIEEVENISAAQKTLIVALRSAQSLDEVKKIIEAAEKISLHASQLVGRLQKPARPETKIDPKLKNEQEKLKNERTAVENKLSELEKIINASASQEKTERSELFALHRELRQVEEERRRLETAWHEKQIELARLEEREKNLNREMQEAMGAEAMLPKSNRPSGPVNTDDLYPKIQRRRYQLELIGGLDPETIKEYEETNERFTFLAKQIEDLERAVKDTEKIITELDEKIKEQSTETFKKINKEFSRFFKMLFGGGSCELARLTAEDLAIEGEIAEEPPPAAEKRDRVVGIDIYATPPGKKLKSLNLLSGGERALTSIALVSAIMATNPAPFVVLDEVDAALDEANTIRFASILDELAKLTQFIIITHNRATMEKADVLYGVTMGEEGTSRVLSVKLENMAAGGNDTARR
jgi:chromosome segregation protein